MSQAQDIVRLNRITKVPLAPVPTAQPFRCWHVQQRSGLPVSDWPEAVHPKALCLHLNFQGEGRLQFKNSALQSLPPHTLHWTRGARAAQRAGSAGSRDPHECLTLVYPDAWLRENLRELAPQLPETLCDLLFKTAQPAFHPGRSLTTEDLSWARSLQLPAPCEAVRALLDRTRVTDFLLRELLAAHGRPPATSASLLSRAERVSHERVARVQQLLQRHLDEPHDLDSLAAAAGCSPHYLSRTFTQVTGIPLMLWIRRARIERAAELLASGRCNVSEAALEVGYRSFSHFSRAFQQEKGVSPSKWVTHLAQAQAPARTPQKPRP